MTAQPVQLPVTVRLPSQLYEKTGGQRALFAPAGTVREVIDMIDESAPGLRFHLCEETGELRSFVNVFLDGVNIRNLAGLETPVPAGAILHIFPSVAGG
ncbi:MAG TPA: MoaD/ThiS family protein [Ktedonobacterales bacterium]